MIVAPSCVVELAYIREILLRNIKTLLEVAYDGAQRSLTLFPIGCARVETGNLPARRHTIIVTRNDRYDGAAPATLVRLQPQSQTASDYSGKTMAVETIHYNGYRLEVVPVGKGWRVSIYPPDSASALRESPAILEKVLKETVIAEAKKIVDARNGTD